VYIELYTQILFVQLTLKLFLCVICIMHTFSYFKCLH